MKREIIYGLPEGSLPLQLTEPIEGKPYKLQVSEGNGTYTGYYVLNQQGDVIAILNASGVKVVSYEYNA